MAIVNAKVSDRSLPRYLRLKRLWRPLLGQISLFLAQSDENARRLVEIGAPADRVRSIGNLKYDIKAPEASEMTSLLRAALPVGAKVLVAGSTLEGEEAMLLDAWGEVVKAEPNAVMVLAPRHTPRFESVAELVIARGFLLTRASELRSNPGTVSAGSIFLLDTIGDLASVYSLGTAAFVGGSLVKWGGHNPLEPARFAVPVATGRWTQNFREIVDTMLAAKAIRVVEQPGLSNALIEMLRGDDHAMGERGLEVFGAQAGATARVAKALVELARGRAA